MGVTIAYLYFSTMIMLLFGREFIPDNSGVWKRIFGEPPLTPKQLKKKQEDEAFARRREFDRAIEWHNQCVIMHSEPQKRRR